MCIALLDTKRCLSRISEAVGDVASITKSRNMEGGLGVVVGLWWSVVGGSW